MEQEKPTGMNETVIDSSDPSTARTGSSRLTRSRQDRVIAGVCGGLGHYFNLDPVLVRVGFVALTLAAGAGILIYILAAIILPEASLEEDHARSDVATVSQGRLIFGGLLILVGAFLLMREIFPWFSDQVIWATVLIALGLAVVLKGTQR